MLRITLTVLAVLALSALVVPRSAAPQGFSMVSGRNHPELTWRVATTEHFKIAFPTHLEHIASEAAPIAEASYRVLSANLGVTFDERIRIYLSDEDEITNGFAVRIGSGYTNIWVHQNDPYPWTGREKWLRHVLAHELAHIFHYRAVRSNAGWLQFLLANPLPRFWAEGLAQYQTETWNAQRGDRALRTAVLDDRLSYTDGRSIRNGQLLYAVGNSQVRYFASQHGDSALRNLLAYREPRLLGLFRVHDFGSAFRETIDTSYRDFYDAWRRHVNVYYNTIAGQMEPLDSLETDPLTLPGQYLYDVQYDPDTSHVAILSIQSVRRPVRRLQVVERETRQIRTVAEGNIRAPLAWSQDGGRLAYSRLGRARHGSMINDLYVVDAAGGGEQRLTRNRRATSPSFSPDGSRIAFAASMSGTANVYVLDLEEGSEHQVTDFTGDVQIGSVSWSPVADRIAFSVFDAEGRRDVMLVEVASGEVHAVAAGPTDERMPVWRPDGRSIAYTSFLDDVPNAFVYHLDTEDHDRVTFLALGAVATDWLPADSAYADGTLVLISNASKEGDRAFRIPAARRVQATTVALPEPYAAWTSHRPPHTVDAQIPPDPSLINSIEGYRPLRNVSHAASLALPYYDSADDWGIFGFTSWVEPLGKHVFAALGALSVRAPREHSFFLASYVNNQLYPSIALTGYRFPGSTRVYGDAVLVEEYTGADVTVRWPLDWRPRPYTGTTLGVRIGVAAYEPLNLTEIRNDLGFLPQPEGGEQADLTVGFVRKRLRPYADNVVHPLDGRGLRVLVTAAGPILGTEREFIRGDIGTYFVFGRSVLPALHRILLYGRLQAQVGSSFPQDYLGFSKYDDVQVDLPGIERVLTGDAERVRGYRRYGLGNRLMFGSLEYRIPLLPSLETRLLGIISLGATTVAGFADAGAVWTDAAIEDADRRLGVGFEFKNALRIGRLFDVAHAIGWGWPLVEHEDGDAELYYRIRMALPF